MLFLSEAVRKSRENLLREFDAGRLSDEQTCHKAIELDPGDYIAQLWLAQLRCTQGDKTGAADCFLKGIDANPWFWEGYVALGQVACDQRILDGLFELACRKLLLNDKAINGKAAERFLNSIRSLIGEGDRSKRQQVEALAKMLGERCLKEGPKVTAQFLPFRLIHRLHETEDLDARTVDDFIKEGDSMLPLLEGTIRAWARAWVVEKADRATQNALALLGEIGDLHVIAHLLEFQAMTDAALAGVAEWALDRVIGRHLQEAVPVMAKLAPTLDAVGRTAIIRELLIPRGLDSDGKLMQSLGENLDVIPAGHLDPFLALFVAALILAHGRIGLEFAQGWFHRNGSAMASELRTKCGEVIEALGADPDAHRTPPGQSHWTVYNICAGEAVWDKDGKHWMDAQGFPGWKVLR